MLTLALILFAGIVWDALITLDLLATVNRRPAVVFCTSTILSVLSCTVYNEVLIVEGYQIDRVIALSLGSGLGAILMMRAYHAVERWLR